MWKIIYFHFQLHQFSSEFVYLLLPSASIQFSSDLPYMYVCCSWQLFYKLKHWHWKMFLKCCLFLFSLFISRVIEIKWVLLPYKWCYISEARVQFALQNRQICIFRIIYNISEANKKHVISALDGTLAFVEQFPLYRIPCSICFKTNYYRLHPNWVFRYSNWRNVH